MIELGEVALERVPSRDACAVATEAVRPAFADVMRAQAPFVLRVARRLGVPQHEVDDVAQDVFLVLHTRYHEWNLDVSIRSILFGIIRRKVANRRRKERTRRESAAFVLEPSHPSPDPLRSFEQLEARAVLDRVLATLDDEKREVFVLFELEGIAMEEVATMTSCSIKTAYSRLQAARELIKRSLLRASATGKIR